MTGRPGRGIRVKLGRVLDGVLIAGGYLSAALGVSVTLLLLVEVVARYILHRPTAWAFDSATYAVLYLAFLGTALVLKEESHVKIEIITSNFSAKTQALITSITSVIACLSCGIFSWQATKVTWQAYQAGYFIDRSMAVPRHFIFWVIALGTFLLCMQFARRAWEHFNIFRYPPSEEISKEIIPKPGL